jgi:serine/threonine-protein kinase
MAIVTACSLIEVLRRLRLLTPEQFGGVHRMAQDRRADPRLIAKSLMARGWLTVYQVNQLLAGHGDELVLGPYHTLDRLGQGGQSLVFKAKHPEKDWVVALKVIRHELLDSAEARQQFLSEMEAMAQLDHPNVVEFWDAGEAGQTFYCAMEYVEGTDLGKLVRLTGMLPPAQASDYARQTAMGLQHAHERNLIHRDIKPVNLILTSPPQPKLDPFARLSTPAPPPAPSVIKILDWGLACLRPPSERETGPSNATPTKAIIGTADYLSPEQARNADQADIRSDIYSLGCTLYYLLTGQPPFPGGSLMQKLIQHQQAEPTPAESLNPEVPPQLAALVRRMMAKKPEERFQTPASVALALTPFCRKPSGGATSGVIRRDPRLTAALDKKVVQDDTPIPSALRTASLNLARPAAPDKAPAPLGAEARRP